MTEIANTPRSDHETRHHALVENLVAELRPVRRLLEGRQTTLAAATLLSARC